MLESRQSDLGMTRSFRRKLVSVGFTAWLMTLTGLLVLPDSPGGVLLVPGSISFVCWLFLLSYALYDVGLFKRYPDERQRKVRNRVYSTSYRLTSALVLVLLVLVLSGQNRVFNVNAVTLENAALSIAVLFEFLVILPVALAAWLEPDPPAEEARELSLS